MMSNCILPFKRDCVYRKDNSNCLSLLDCPYNSDAACFRVSGKGKMIDRAKDYSDNYLYQPLKITTFRHHQGFLTIFVGKKKLCILQWLDPLPEGSPRWWLGEMSMGTNELDAVENILKHFGYRK